MESKKTKPKTKSNLRKGVKMDKVKLPKPIKVSKDDAVSWEQLLDREYEISSLVQNLGKDKRLVWGGMAKTYNLEPEKYQYTYDRKKKEIRATRELPEYARDYLTTKRFTKK